MRGSVESLVDLAFFFAGAFLLSVVINAIMMRFVRNLGMRHQQDITVRWSNQSKPAVGGISFYISYLMGFMFYAIIFGQQDVFHNSELLGLFITITLAFLLGLSDDAYDTKPLIKLGIQILCGFILIWTDNAVQLFDTVWINHLITVVWVVGIMNSINMLDNMDGITTISSIFIILTIIGISIPFELVNNVEIFLLITVLGALCGFLIFNWNPSKMFMGDTGSQFLGMFLAFFSIKFLWNAGIETGNYSEFSNFTLVLIAFSVPLMDTTFVTVRRLARGERPWVGGKDHSTHMLSYKGLTDRQVALVFIGLGLIGLMLSLNIAKYIPKDSLLLVSMWFYVGVLLLIFFTFAKSAKK
ncbi:MAG: undecaprenyl/decaprenyl-phosphate alpha-N-acetylglucosaminyl 1-phosphate transferase [Crocinitomicaceae bacterium]|jgi:UDP-GlcNAc:undecaprenyl-phosphate GlcNAc-1-phosphate transferase|nr:undecaprenyl/decaprenyl-phosphate alpha-N-acetylglucosaminyl 1-phosphate transferase [Crocinitomicaceae bacterium]